MLLFSCFIGSIKLQDKDGDGPVGVPLPSALSKKYGVQVKSTTSGSSGEQSDDDEAEGENESSQNRDPTDVKRMRRYTTEYLSCHGFCLVDSFETMLEGQLRISLKCRLIHGFSLV